MNKTKTKISQTQVGTEPKPTNDDASKDRGPCLVEFDNLVCPSDSDEEILRARFAEIARSLEMKEVGHKGDQSECTG